MANGFAVDGKCGKLAEIPTPRIFRFPPRRPIPLVEILCPPEISELPNTHTHRLPKISKIANPGFFVLFVLPQGVCQRKGAGGKPAGFSEAEAAATD